jgi:hypothetical protein
MSGKDEVAPEAAEEAQKWPLPYNIGMDKLDLIVKAFLQAGADIQKVSANDLLGRTGLNVNTIKGNMKFLSAIGILKPAEEKDSYMFETKGATYAKALAANDDKTVSTVLKELMINSYLKELIDYAELQKSSGLTFEQLFQHIKGMARLKEDPKYGTRGIAAPYSTGIAALIDLLARAGIVSQDIIAKKETVRMPTPVRKVTQRSGEQQPSAETRLTTTVGPIQGTVTNFPFTLNITVEAKDPESIKQLISLIKELRGQPEQSSS